MSMIIWGLFDDVITNFKINFTFELLGNANGLFWNMKVNFQFAPF
jgi:hypothetical protein